MTYNKKLKVQFASDLHLEFLGHPTNAISFIESLQSNADVLILAGDITVSEYLKYTLTLFCSIWKHVVYVPGNHTYYHSSFNTVHNKLRSMSEKLDNLHWLHGSSSTIEGQRFIGGTLWFPENKDSTDFFLQQRLNDFRCISDIKKNVFLNHNKTKNYLYNNVERDDIVVTHHLPHISCVDEQFKNDPLNCFYHAKADKLVETKQPKIWHFGHTHSSCDFMLDKTRMICNPHGYLGQAVNPDWNNNLVVEV